MARCILNVKVDSICFRSRLKSLLEYLNSMNGEEVDYSALLFIRIKIQISMIVSRNYCKTKMKNVLRSKESVSERIPRTNTNLKRTENV